MQTKSISLKDKYNHGWGFEQDFKDWNNETIIQWIGILDETDTFVDKYEEIFQLQNINGFHFTKDNLGNSQWCREHLGIDEDTAEIFAFLVQQRIKLFAKMITTELDTEKPEEKYEENDLQIACIKTMECKCGDSNPENGDLLYACTNKQCSMEIYCEDCGVFYHNRKKSKKNHSFDIESKEVVLIQDLVQTPADADCVNCGTRAIIALIGNEKYKQIKPILEKGIALVGSNFPMCCTLGFELHQFFNAASIAVSKANHAADALVALRAAKDNVDGILDLMVWYIKIWGAETHVWKTKIEAANALKNPLATQKIIKSGAVGMGVATLIEMSVHAYRYFKKDISGKEWLRLSGKAIVRNGVCLVGTAIGGNVGAWAGCYIGAGIGTTISPGLGTAVGASVGIITGMFMGFYFGKGAEYMYEYVFPSGEEAARRKLIKEALVYFHLQEKDIDNKNIFNEKALKKLFKQFALNAHPDRRGGDYEEWHRLSTYYGILKALLEQNEQNKKLVTKTMKKETVKPKEIVI